MLLTDRLYIGGSYGPLLDLDDFLEWLPVLRKTVYLLDFWLFIKRIQVRNSQMEEMHRAGWGGRSPKLLCSVQVSCPPSTSRLQLLEPSHALQLGVLTEVLLRRHSNGLVISSASRPPSLLGRWRGLAEFQPSYHWFGSPGNQPPSVGAFQKPIHRSSGVVERDTLGITTDSPFTFTYEIPRVLELLMKLQEF